MKQATECPHCKRLFPSRAAMRRHFTAGCCRDPMHLLCSVCSPLLGALGREITTAMREKP